LKRIYFEGKEGHFQKKKRKLSYQREKNLLNWWEKKGTK